MKSSSSDVVERLRRAAQSSSDIARQMAEAKSLRQEGNTECRTDLYMWPTPEQTLEGQALATIERLSAELERVKGALGECELAIRTGVETKLSGEPVLAIHCEYRDELLATIWSAIGKPETRDPELAAIDAALNNTAENR
jgi:hypothetical protein